MSKASDLGIIVMLPGNSLPEIEYAGTHINYYVVVSKEKDQIVTCTYEMHGGVISIPNSTCERKTIDFF